MGKPNQTRKEKKYLKAGDLVETVKLMWGHPLDGLASTVSWHETPKIGSIGLILSVKGMTKRDPSKAGTLKAPVRSTGLDRQSSCVILFGERKWRFDGDYWACFKRIEQKP